MEKSDEIYISFIVPAYNEAKRLPMSCELFKTFLKSFPYPTEILLIIEKSTDHTVLVAQDFAKLFAKEPGLEKHQFLAIDNLVQKGKGYAVRSGMQRARGELQFFMDVDLSTPLAEVNRFVKIFQEDAATSVLIGSRGQEDSNVIERQSWLRETMGKTFNFIVRLFSGLNFIDTQCGFKAFRKDAAKQIFAVQSLNGFSFDVEILMLAKRFGFQTRSIGVEWKNSADSKVHIIKDSLKMLRDVIRLRLRWMMK